MVVDGPPEPTDSRTNLPATRVVLYGRAAEIERLAGEVLSATGRLVTITGPGGVGKTSVALAVACQVLPDLHHGAWLVDLSTLRMSRALPQAVARATGVRESYAATIDETLTAFLRDRELLLVMDNCVHVVDACATLLDELLDQAPGLRVLATSREPLRIRGEVMYALPPLAVPIQAPDRDLGRLRGRVGPALPRSSSWSAAGPRVDESQCGHDRGNLPSTRRHPARAGTGRNARGGPLARAHRRTAA